MKDNVLRAMTDDGAFRVMAVRATETVRGAAAAQQVSGRVSQVFGELLTGAVLVRETMAPDLRLQALLMTREPVRRMVADCHPGGATRGLVQSPPGEKQHPLHPGALLQMMRTLHDGSLHQGTVEVPSDGTVSSAMMQYMQASEQVVSMIAVGCILDDVGGIACAGGYIVQLLPEVVEGPLALMTERLADFESIDSLLRRGAADPQTLLDEILYGMPFTKVGDSDVNFACVCSETRLTLSLSTLPRHEIEAMLHEGKVLEITCDYCAKDYRIAPERLRGLVAKN